MKGFGLVRKADGTPRIDDPTRLHPSQILALTPEERAAHGLWEGPLAIDAQGVKRLRKTAKGYEAVDALVAVSEVYDSGKHYRVEQRADVPIGGALLTGG